MNLVRPATGADIEAVRAVAMAAGERFREVADVRIARCADDPPPSRSDLEELISGGLLLVREDGGVPVGFVALAVVDGRAHIEEISVDVAAQGRGHGVALLVAVDRWSALRGLDGVSLTTFRDVAWNRPYYERRGFAVLDGGSITPQLRALMDHEATLGLEPDLRVAMWKPPA